MFATKSWEPDMRRRQFLGAAAAAACSVSTLAPDGLAGLAAQPLPDTSTGSSPFPLSVMLWTVRRELPFDQRLEIVSQSGYHAVQLVNEYKDWSKEDFARARR